MHTINQRTARIIWLVVLLCGCSVAGFGQAKFTISGTIKDAQNGESLIGATVLAKGDAGSAGAITNAYGFYSLSVPEGTYTLTVQYVSFTTQTRVVQPGNN